MDQQTTKNSVGESILRQYAQNLGPQAVLVQNEDDRRHLHFITSITTPISTPKAGSPTIPSGENTSSFGNNNNNSSSSRVKNAATSPITSLPKAFRLPKALLAHRNTPRSTDVPGQTILKVMASRQAPGAMTSQLGLSGHRTALNDNDTDPVISTSPKLSARLNKLSTTVPSNWPQIAPQLLQSPCFFHQRFEGLIDFEKVLDETNEEDYSHSRLMQTATGVREVSKQLARRPLKRAVKKIMIVTKARDNKLVTLTRDLAEWLLSKPRYGSDLGVTVYVDAKLRSSKRFDAAGLLKKEPRFQHMLKYWYPDLCWSAPDNFDLVLTLGGDGTVLFTSWLFQRVVPPILSFALGSLGFLTNFEFDRYKEHLDKVMGEGGMRVNLRMRFTCTVWRADRSPGAEKGAVEEGEQFEVLNELVIDRGPSAYVSNLELYRDNQLLTIVQADGCIFSTPTGSTAYSLSAGGSLIEPSIPGILLTPICPHTLSFRPMVLSDHRALRIAIPLKSRASAYCSFDGKGRIELKQGDYVTLEASHFPMPTVIRDDYEWMESIQKSFGWNNREAVQKGWDADGEELGGTEDDDESHEIWDIDTDNNYYNNGGTDSGIGQSEDGDAAQQQQQLQGQGTSSPNKKQPSLLSLVGEWPK